MTIKSILVPFNAAEAASDALSIAIKMARKYDAHLTGLFCTDSERALGYGLSAYPNIVKAAREGFEEQKAKCTELFHERIAAEAGERRDQVRWITVERDPDNAVIEYARYADITVIGSVPSGTVREETEFHADRVALMSGRPALVVPKGYTTEVLGEHAVVAWDGKRASARALGDAMQILENKAKVTVLTVGNRAPAMTEGLDIAEHIRRHGIETEMVTIPRQGHSIADAIVEYCGTSGAGLLVMGAYEHSKFNEDLFGGTTNSVLRKSKIPTLMAH